MSWYPLLLEPAVHVKVWGGRQLETVMGKSLPTDEPYGEAWELHDSVTVANGPYAGRTIGELIAVMGHALIGQAHDPVEGMPLLAKLIDASAWLSVQVHPNDVQARELEGDPRGKTEAWIILATEPDARLVVGLKPGTSREAVAAAIRENTLEDLLVYATVQPGDVLYMPANTVHALGPGILLYEIQQSSNITYRLYDWGRMGLDGKPRELHIQKGVQVSNLETLPEITHPDPKGATTVLVSGEYFETVLHQLDDHVVVLETSGRFHALTCIEGAVMAEASRVQVPLQSGQTVLVPADVPRFTLSGNGKVLRSFSRLD